MSRWLGLTSGLIVASILVRLPAWTHKPDPGPLVDIAPETFRAALVERGEIGSEREIKLSSTFSSKVEMLLPEGSVVKPHDVVIKLNNAEAIDLWERQHLKDRQNALQLPLTTERGRMDIWRLSVGRENAALDLAMAKARFAQLVEVRDRAAIVEAAQTLGTLKAERKTLMGTLPEAKELHRKGYIADTELAQMQRRLAEIDAQSVAMRVKLASLEVGPRREEIALERLKVEEMASALEGAELRLRSGKVGARLDLESAKRAMVRSGESERYRRKVRDDASVTAPQAGVVIYDEIWTGNQLAKVKVGDAVDEGNSLVTIADPARQVVRAKVIDAVAARLRTGIAVLCKFDAYPGLVVPGKIRAIAPVAGSRLDGDLNNLQAVEVRVALDHPDARLRPGMSANMAFELASEPGRLSVPTEAIVHDAYGDAVYALARPTGWHAWLGRFTGPVLERRAVLLGASNERQTVVTMGLTAGDRVAMQPPSGSKQP